MSDNIVQDKSIEDKSIEDKSIEDKSIEDKLIFKPTYKYVMIGSEKSFYYGKMLIMPFPLKFLSQTT